MLYAFNLFIYTLFGVLVMGSLLPLSTHPHWFIRAWDFPRVQLVTIAVGACAIYVAANLLAGELVQAKLLTMIGLTVLIAAWHLVRIVPYTPLVKPQAKSWEASPKQKDADGQVGDAGEMGDDGRRLRVLISNVEMENDQYSLWSDVVCAMDADVMILAEIDQRWKEKLDEIQDLYPHQVVFPQDNWYGIALLSRLPIIKSEIRFRVQDDIPSIDAMIEMPSGDRVRILGVHPRPPEPVRDNDATARDAELALWGKELAEDQQPIVIGGDMNDVAWSESTRLFLRLSELLDPRRGRGFFNSFHADHFWMRFPLDHVFHSTHFTIRSLRRLDFVGSDHFPIFIDLQLNPVPQPDQDPLEKKSSDNEEAQERIQRAEDEETAQN